MDEVTEQLAADLFGGRDALASKILESLEKRDPSRRALRRETSVKTLATTTREELLESLETAGISLNEIMRCEWNDSSLHYWKDKMNSSGSGTGIASGGASAPIALLLNTYVRLEALGEVCSKSAPSSKLVPKEQLVSLRAKYRAMSAG